MIFKHVNYICWPIQIRTIQALEIQLNSPSMDIEYITSSKSSFASNTLRRNNFDINFVASIIVKINLLTTSTASYSTLIGYHK